MHEDGIADGNDAMHPMATAPKAGPDAGFVGNVANVDKIPTNSNHTHSGKEVEMT